MKSSEAEHIMATTTQLPTATGPVTISHTYHAEAHALSGKLQRPIEQEIEQHANLALNGLQDGHFSRLVERVSVHGLVNFEKAQTRVSGTRSLKHNGWVTLSTSVLEGLNVFEVIQADRLVSQVSTDHAYENGHVPRVTFLGTHFDNLRVSGVPTELDLDLGICGEVPEGGKSYLEDEDFLKKVKKQNEAIVQADCLPIEVRSRYRQSLDEVNVLLTGERNGNANGNGRPERKVMCSLVRSIGDIPAIPGVKPFENILLIPEFGAVALGELAIRETMHEGSDKPCVSFELTSIHMNLGCVGQGTVLVGTALSNGGTRP
jgi:hypothetical protein